MDKANNKLILYELNEVPVKLLNYYTTLKPNSNFNYLINSGKLKPTITNDIGELHPWSTWPTVHRGVNNNIHNIRFINQDLKCAKAWPPIWETISLNNISIGIFGSLQSYPPIINKNVKFFLCFRLADEHKTKCDQLHNSLTQPIYQSTYIFCIYLNYG